MSVFEKQSIILAQKITGATGSVFYQRRTCDCDVEHLKGSMLTQSDIKI